MRWGIVLSGRYSRRTSSRECSGADFEIYTLELLTALTAEEFGFQIGLGTKWFSTIQEERASVQMHARAIPMHEDGGEVLQLHLRTMQFQDGRW